jgi:DNA invertase Pin-like site-specific DNA recombinase
VFRRTVAKFKRNATELDPSRISGLGVAQMSRKAKASKRLIGYARVSTAGQDLTRQVLALKAERCTDIFSDTASGKSLAGRPELAKAIGKLAPGDVLVLAEWDRCTRSMWDGLHIVRQVLDAGATIRVLDFPSLDLTTPEGRGFLALFSAMAERERMRIVKRTGEGRRLAIAAGRPMGRKPKLSAHQQRSARARLANGESTRDVAKDFAVHHATIARLR